MNRSGGPVQAMAAFYKVPAERILVMHDELDLLPGTARLKRGGGHGGHNGLRDLERALGTRDYWYCVSASAIRGIWTQSSLMC